MHEGRPSGGERPSLRQTEVPEVSLDVWGYRRVPGKKCGNSIQKFCSWEAWTGEESGN